MVGFFLILYLLVNVLINKFLFVLNYLENLVVGIVFEKEIVELIMFILLEFIDKFFFINLLVFLGNVVFFDFFNCFVKLIVFLLV